MARTSVRALTACAVRPAPVPAAFSVRTLTCGGGPCSLLARTRELMLPTVELNLIRVGEELFGDEVESEIDFAVATIQLIYSAVDFWFGPVRDYHIHLADANGHEFIDNEDEVRALTDEWTVSEDGIDVFLVVAFPGTTNVGLSPVAGPCDKNAPRLTGSTIAVNFAPLATGFALAHEIGHYLGLQHRKDEDNLMFPTIPNGGQLTAEQAEDIRHHCFTRLRCR